MTTKRKIPWKAVWLFPAVAIPVAAALFYGLGGGQPTQKQAPVTTGLNRHLPTSIPEVKSPLDKFSMYELAEADSLKRAREREADPLFGNVPQDPSTPLAERRSVFSPAPSFSYLNNGTPDANELKVHQKLAELDRQLQPILDPPKPAAGNDMPIPDRPLAPPPVGAKETDGELEQINAIMEKVLDVQYPQRVTQKLQQQSAKEKTKIFPVVARPEEPITDLLLEPTPKNTNEGVLPARRGSATGFYEWTGGPESPVASNAVRAVIHETKTVLSGATIKLRLEQDLYLQGTLIPTGHFVFGIGTLSGDRYTIAISDIRYQNAIYPVGLEVIGMDGMPGIHIEGAIGRDMIRSRASDGVQSMQLATLDPSLKAQAAAATVETAKSLLGRKMKQTNVTLKAGEPVLLRDSNQQ